MRFFTVSLILLVSQFSVFARNDYPIQPVSFERVTIEDSFWNPRIETNRVITIPYAFKKCEDTGRVDNLRIAGGIKEGTSFLTTFPFDDSDIYKIIEGAAYSLSVHPDPDLDRYVDHLIEIISLAQEDDGYIYAARTIQSEKPVMWVDGPRWSNIRIGHELYNVGHMYEAAVAHYLATGKRSFLNVAIKSADLIDRVFGPGKKVDVPGHQEIEIGLVKLYRVTGEERYLNLAKYFLDQRGHDEERELYGDYCQDHKPVIEQDEAVGHAVRAGYMYTAMTDIAAISGDKEYQKAIQAIWDNVVSKKIYITGGIGARHSGEAFGGNYELPNFSAYNETCAAIANILWNYRMFLLFGDAKYMDVLERTLYNGMLSGIALSGDRFFYPNPLAAGKGGNQRSLWFDCSCCPSNLSRFIPSIPGYIYAQKDNDIYINLFMGSRTDFSMNNNKISVQQETSYPWNGNVNIQVSPERESRFNVKIRIPGWARNEPMPSGLYRYLKQDEDRPVIAVNGESVSYQVNQGYASIERSWKKGDRVEFALPMKVRRVTASDKIEEDRGKTSLEYGPIVYCVEWPDYDDSVFNLLLTDDAKLTVKTNQNLYNLVNGVNVIQGNAYSLKYSKDKSKVKKTRKSFRAIPYYARAHRGAGEMNVWLARDDKAIRPTPPKTIASTCKVSYSFKRGGGESLLSESALNDQQEPEDSDDQTIPRFHWWSHLGTTEWVQYDFPKAAKISSSRVYWFDDTGHGGCRVPESWQLLYLDGGRWTPVSNPSGYGINKDRYNEVDFDPVKTNALRLEVKLQEKMSGGILEWEVK